MTAIKTGFSDETLEQGEPLPVWRVVAGPKHELARVTLFPNLKLRNQVGWNRERPLSPVLDFETIFISLRHCQSASAEF